MSDGTVQDSRNMVVYLLDPDNEDCFHKQPSPVQWGYVKVKDPEKIPEPHRDIAWNEYVLFLNDGELIGRKEYVAFQMAEARITVNIKGRKIERDLSVAVLTGSKICKDIPFD